MPGGTIDSLEIEISASSDAAVKKLESLADTLKQLKSVLGGDTAAKINDLSESMKMLRDSMAKVRISKTLTDGLSAFGASLKSIDLSRLQGFSRIMQGLSGLQNVKMSTSLTKGLREVADLVENISEAAVNRLDRMTAALQRLAGVNLTGLRNAAKMVSEDGSAALAIRNAGMTAGGRSGGGGRVPPTGNGAGPQEPDWEPINFNLPRLSGESEKATAGISKLNAVLLRFKDIQRSVGSAIRSFIVDGLKNSIHPLQAFGHRLSGVLSAFKRILFYRMIRTIIKEIGDAFRTGINDLYEYSKATERLSDGSFAKSMNDGATALLYLKNSIGAAISPIIQAFIPVLDSLIDKIVEAINWINQLFAKLTGKDYWYKAKKVATEYAGAASKAGGAAKEALKYLAPFDELNRLPDDTKGGGGGGSSTPDFSEMFEEADFDSSFDWVDKLKEKLEGIKEFMSGLTFSLKNVLFNWDGEMLTPENIAEKVMFAAFGAAGAIIGWTLGGPGGAAVGFLLGGTLGLALARLTFDYDGFLSSEEVTSLVLSAVFGISGAVIGWNLGGPAGAAAGFMIGATIGIGLSHLTFDYDGFMSVDEVSSLVAGAVFGVSGAIIGWAVGGPVGAAVGLSLGASLGLVISKLTKPEYTGEKSDVLKRIAQALGLSGSPIGGLFAVVINLAIKLKSKNVEFQWYEDLKKTVNDNIETIKTNWDSYWEEMGDAYDEFIDDIKNTQAYKDLQSTIESGKETFKEAAKALKDDLAGAYDDLKKKIEDSKAFKDFIAIWESAKGTFQTVRDAIQTYLIDPIQSLIDKIGELINKIPVVGTIKTNIETIKNDLKAGWDTITGKNKKTNTTSTPSALSDDSRWRQELEKLTRGYATGGFPEDGLFWANHNELVGRFSNGKTAVANNDQIVAGISAGVEDANESVVTAIYSAATQMVNAIRESGGGSDVDWNYVAQRVSRAQRSNARAMGTA